MTTLPRLSLLELLLPGGRAERALVLGSACPPRLRPAFSGLDGSGHEPAELVVIAPDEAERTRAGWLADAVATCGARLAPDGLAYVLVRRDQRSEARTLLDAQGLQTESLILHLPDAAESWRLIPLEPVPASYAFSGVVPLAPWKRLAAGAVLRLGGAG